jgi:hypothetical protein
MLGAAYWSGLFPRRTTLVLHRSEVWTEPVRSIIQLEVSDKLSALVVGRYPSNTSVETRENNAVVRKSDWPSFTWQKSRCGIKIRLPRYFSRDALLKDERV